MRPIIVQILLIPFGIIFTMATVVAGPSNDVRTAFKKAFGEDFKTYTWLSLPVDNFGVCTMFKLKSRSDKPSDANQLCATWSCLNKEKPKDIRDELTVFGFVDEGQGRPLQFTENKTRKLGIALIVKPLLASLGIDGSLADSKRVTTTFKTGPAYKRVANIDRLKTFMMELEPSSERYAAFNSGSLAFIKADLVITDVEVTIKLNQKTDAKLDAALNSASEGSGQAKTRTMELSVQKTGSGLYVLKNPGASIYAVLAVKPPKAKSLTFAPPDVEKYEPVRYAQ